MIGQELASNHDIALRGKEKEIERQRAEGNIKLQEVRHELNSTKTELEIHLKSESRLEVGCPINYCILG